MDAVVPARDAEGAVRDGDALVHVDAVALGAEIHAAALKQERARALEPRAGTVHREAAGGDAEKALRVLDLDPLVPRLEGEGGVFRAEAVVHVQGVARGLDRDVAARDDEIVVRVDAVLPARRDAQTAGAVYGEIVPACDDAAAPGLHGLVAVNLAAGHAVLGPVREGEEDLVGLVDAQARVVRAGDVRPVQHDPDLGAAVGAHDEGAVLQRAGDAIAPGLGEDHLVVIGVGPAAADAGVVAEKGDLRRAGGVPGTVAVVAGEEGGIAALYRVPVHDGLDAEALAVYEQDRDKERADEDGNADEINVLVR